MILPECMQPVYILHILPTSKEEGKGRVGGRMKTLLGS